MKNKLLALLATIGLVSSASAVEINENLSISGFIDGSYQKGDGGTMTKASILMKSKLTLMQMSVMSQLLEKSIDDTWS